MTPFYTNTHRTPYLKSLFDAIFYTTIVSFTKTSFKVNAFEIDTSLWIKATETGHWSSSNLAMDFETSSSRLLAF
jgi:hypothetical protein